MKFAFAFVALMMAAPAFANDGGVAAIKVSEIKMREYNEQGTEVKRIANPNYKITFKGGEAAKLQQILPSTVSVITAIQPELAKAYAETFKTLGIYSNDSQGVKAKVITINCSNGQLIANGEKSKIVKSKESECSIEINGVEGGTADDMFGDKQEFAPKCSN